MSKMTKGPACKGDMGTVTNPFDSLYSFGKGVGKEVVSMMGKKRKPRK